MKFACSTQPTLNVFGPASRWWQLTSWMTLTSSSFTRWVETPHTHDHFPLVFVSLLTRTLVVVLQGRDFPWSSCSRAFCWLPAEKPEQRVQAPICCLDLLLDCLTHQVSYKFREPPLFNFLSPIFWPTPTQNIIIQIFRVKIYLYVFSYIFSYIFLWPDYSSVTSQRADFSDSDQPFCSSATPVMGNLHSQYIMDLD